MVDTTWNDLEVASKWTVMQAARQFAEVLAETVQFRTFEQAYYNFRQDADAQNAIQNFPEKAGFVESIAHVECCEC